MYPNRSALVRKKIWLLDDVKTSLADLAKPLRP
jgi:hypothetical protein